MKTVQEDSQPINARTPAHIFALWFIVRAMGKGLVAIPWDARDVVFESGDARLLSAVDENGTFCLIAAGADKLDIATEWTDVVVDGETDRKEEILAS